MLVLSCRDHLGMSFSEAAKFARVATCWSVYPSDDEGSGSDEASESCGAFISVYHVGAGGWGEVSENDEDLEEGTAHN
ncbi:OLC1v1028703C1 [Oldenlandia corymbosa var. corymbosa]|uniref:OLC1v1028703C1 n=1 Tax=Oldenlandia corymbosa var. corymbosa TaxID=529605 RepID=A0AAV1CCT2_OLDCO|nr:OLC1v1028703C1 [Oldenlandia corymbosa var. corymbosa]